MTVTTHKSRAISRFFYIRHIHEFTRAGADHGTRDAPPPLWPPPARLWATTWPPPTRRAPPRGRGTHQRRRSRIHEITPKRAAPTAPARGPRGGGGGGRARRVRSTRASDTAGDGAGRAGRHRGRPAAVTSVTGRRAASAGGQLGVLRRRCDGAATCGNAANGAG